MTERIRQSPSNTPPETPQTLIEALYKRLPVSKRLIDQPQYAPKPNQIAAFEDVVDHFDEAPKVGLGKKIIENVRCIGRDDFESIARNEMSRAIDTFVGNDPYYILFTVGSSGQRLYPHLHLQRNPEGLIAHNDTERLKDFLAIEGQSACKLVLVDDAVYSGGNIGIMTNSLKKLPNYSKRLLIATIAAAKEGIERLITEEDVIHLYSHYKIPSVSEIFTDDEIEHIEYIDGFNTDHSKYVLTIFHDRIPDNFLRIAYQGIRKAWQKPDEPKVVLLDRIEWNKRGRRGLLYPDGTK